MAAQFCVHFVCFMAVLSSAASQASSDYGRDEAQRCPEEWFGPHRNTCYRLVDDAPLSWSEASSTGCQAKHSSSHLAAITFDNKAFLSKQQEMLGNSISYWIGLRSNETQFNAGTEFAVDVDYTNWETLLEREPDGMGTERDCVLVMGNWAGKELAGIWEDFNCESRLPFVCEMPEAQNGGCHLGGWEHINGKCLALFQNHLVATWRDAFDFCRSLSSTRLAIIDFQIEESSPLLDTVAFWMALRSTPSEDGVLRWSTDGPAPAVKDTNWSARLLREPDGDWDNVCVSVHGFKSVDVFTNGEWKDLYCDMPNSYLCELHL